MFPCCEAVPCYLLLFGSKENIENSQEIKKKSSVMQDILQKKHLHSARVKVLHPILGNFGLRKTWVVVHLIEKEYDNKQ
jgi:hypothetical protein